MKVLYKGKFITLIEYLKYEFIKGQETILALPYFKDPKTGDTKYAVRFEYCPCYFFGEDTHPQNYYTGITGGVEKKEKPLNAAIREIREESGLILKDYKIIYEDKFPYSKASSTIFNFFFIEALDFSFEVPKGDGTENEAKSKAKFLTKSEIRKLNYNTKTKKDFIFTFLYNFIENRTSN